MTKKGLPKNDFTTTKKGVPKNDLTKNGSQRTT